ncbi:MAG TPA: hypothetical protein VHG72_21920 [Polyangia bacterium]|nr:hypothetical protein [Polyangia bacterium]
MISKVFEAVKTQLDAVLLSLGQPVPTHELGLEHQARNDSFPRIVWELLGGEVHPPRQTAADGRIGIRQIAERRERIAIHVWEKDFEHVEILMNHFVAAAREVMTAFPFKALSTNWEPGQSGQTPYGRVCVLVVEVCIPFTAEPLAISAAPHTATIESQVNA